MKTNNFILAILVAGSLTIAGAACHKQAAAVEKPKTLGDGVTALQSALMTASPQVQSNFYNGVAFGIRYGDNAKATAYLQQIAADPSLTDQQKQLVGFVGDLLKQGADGQKK